MKRSAAVPLTVVATLSAGAVAAACGPRSEPLQCVDRTTQRVVPDSVCARAGVAPSDAAGAPGAGGPGTEAGSVHRGGFPGGLFAWYYGGRIVQGLVSGGSYAPIAGRAYRSPGGYVARSRPGGGFGVQRAAPSGRSGVSRGGFGRTGAGRFGGG